MKDILIVINNITGGCPMTEIKPYLQYIKEELEKALEKRFAELPWWCLLCGEGGNYEDERPDEYWFPPKDHICKPNKPNLVGIK